MVAPMLPSLQAQAVEVFLVLTQQVDKPRSQAKHATRGAALERDESAMLQLLGDAHLRHQLGQGKRLRDRAGHLACRVWRQLRVGADDEHRVVTGGWLRLQLAQHLQPGLVGQRQVQQDHVRGVLLGEAQPGLPIGSWQDSVPLVAGQDVGQEGAQPGVVFDQQHRLLGRA
jgi:hypothetical protein